MVALHSKAAGDSEALKRSATRIRPSPPASRATVCSRSPAAAGRASGSDSARVALSKAAGSAVAASRLKVGGSSTCSFEEESRWKVAEGSGTWLGLGLGLGLELGLGYPNPYPNPNQAEGSGTATGRPAASSAALTRSTCGASRKRARKVAEAPGARVASVGGSHGSDVLHSSCA